MLTTVKIGEKDLNLLANAATPIRYKMIFGEDLMVVFNQIQSSKRDTGELLDVTAQLAYIMNRQAECDKAELSRLSKDTYLEWLEDFGPMDFVNASEAIINTYLNQGTSSSAPKKEEGRPKEK